MTATRYGRKSVKKGTKTCPYCYAELSANTTRCWSCGGEVPFDFLLYVPNVKRSVVELFLVRLVLAIPLMLTGFLIGSRFGGYFIGTLAAIFGIALTLQLARSLFPEITGSAVTFTCRGCGSIEKAKKRGGKPIEVNDIIDVECHNCGSITRIEIKEQKREITSLSLLKSHLK